MNTKEDAQVIEGDKRYWRFSVWQYFTLLFSFAMCFMWMIGEVAQIHCPCVVQENSAGKVIMAIVLFFNTTIYLWIKGLHPEYFERTTSTPNTINKKT